MGTNGYFTFSTFTGFTPFRFEQGNGLSLVAPFFTDIDISRGQGSITYSTHDDFNEELSTAVAQSIDAAVNTVLHTNFSTQWFVVASWSDVAAYGKYDTVSLF